MRKGKAPDPTLPMWERLGMRMIEARVDIRRDQDEIIERIGRFRQDIIGPSFAEYDITFERFQLQDPNAKVYYGIELVLLLEHEYGFVIERIREDTDANPFPIKTIGAGLTGWAQGLIRSRVQITFLELNPTAPLQSLSFR